MHTHLPTHTSEKIRACILVRNIKERGISIYWMYLQPVKLCLCFTCTSLLTGFFTFARNHSYIFSPLSYFYISCPRSVWQVFSTEDLSREQLSQLLVSLENALQLSALVIQLIFLKDAQFPFLINLFLILC